jgi:hypothetical protein
MTATPTANAFRKALSNMLYACAGDTRQYEETLDVIHQSVEKYVMHLTASANRRAHTAGVIRAEDVIAALDHDPTVKARVQRLFEAGKEFNRERKEMHRSLASSR